MAGAERNYNVEEDFIFHELSSDESNDGNGLLWYLSDTSEVFSDDGRDGYEGWGRRRVPSAEPGIHSDDANEGEQEMENLNDDGIHPDDANEGDQENLSDDEDALWLNEQKRRKNEGKWYSRKINKSIKILNRLPKIRKNNKRKRRLGRCLCSPFRVEESGRKKGRSRINSLEILGRHIIVNGQCAARMKFCLGRRLKNGELDLEADLSKLFWP